MAFNPFEDFSSYSDGDSIDGLNGGSGWGGAWDLTNVTAVISDVDPFDTGMKSVVGESPSTIFARQFGEQITTTPQTVYLALKCQDIVDTNRGQINFMRGTNAEMFIKFAAGKIQIYDGGYQNTTWEFAVDEWFVLEVIITNTELTVRFHNGTEWDENTYISYPFRVVAYLDGIQPNNFHDNSLGLVTTENPFPSSATYYQDIDVDMTGGISIGNAKTLLKSIALNMNGSLSGLILSTTKAIGIGVTMTGVLTIASIKYVFSSAYKKIYKLKQKARSFILKMKG